MIKAIQYLMRLFCFCFKTMSSCKTFRMKMSSVYLHESTCRRNTFLNEWFLTMTRFDTEANDTRKWPISIVKQNNRSPITKGLDNTVNQSKLEVITCNWRKAWDNNYERVTIGAVLARVFLSQSWIVRVEMESQLLFGTSENPLY